MKIFLQLQMMCVRWGLHLMLLWRKLEIFQLLISYSFHLRILLQNCWRKHIFLQRRKGFSVKFHAFYLYINLYSKSNSCTLQNLWIVSLQNSKVTISKFTQSHISILFIPPVLETDQNGRYGWPSRRKKVNFRITFYPPRPPL